MTTEVYQPEQKERERRDAAVDTAEFPPVRRIVDKAYARATGSPLVHGNGVRLLVDAEQNYPAWLEAIKGARRTIHFESFIIHEDEVGRQFAEALSAKAREGVKVRVVYDWLGAVGKTSRRFWRNLRDAGVEVKGFNPPRFDEPFGWFNRDHRKMISVDGQLGFVMGLCVGRDWVGRPEKGIEPWRDTGVEIRGPAVADMDAAFARVWETACGEKIPDEQMPARDSIEPGGEVAVRVIATEPNTVGLYRLEQLVAAGARSYLWLTDAYFVGTNMYVQALRAAAQDGVDVRLLVPSASDIPVVSALSRANYRALLEAGVRVFEWNGPMIHAKTSVVDGKWARVGSTNLNVASWMGNWELDVTIENEGFAHEMQEMYCRDLEHATEIVISDRKRVKPIGPPRPRKGRRQRTSRKGSTSRAAAGVIGVGSAVGAAITNRRVLGPAEARLMGMAGGVLLGLSIIAVKWPRGITYPLAFIGTWVALALFIRAYKLHKGETLSREKEMCEPPPSPAPEREGR
ncbi:MAG: phospholipase D-like domain-containing protein [Pyrinomonadaceae bacterium]